VAGCQRKQTEQDFAALGVELKTIPIDSQGKPLETTFVCVAPLTGNTGVTWETSHVRHKLKRVCGYRSKVNVRSPG
jgi:DNA mismatch repair protein MutH